jgi:NADPH-dependent glutamate synthase beta subunit-like oxidoreductase
VEEGMVVLNDHPEVTKARRTALELLLSDHVGDCMGPCQVACPAGMDIPRMIRYMEAGHYDKAIEVIKRDIALPAVTGYICPAPCEKSCRRGQLDNPIAIRLLKRFAAEVDLFEPTRYHPAVSRDTGKKVAIVGSGPAGLAASYHLQLAGISCTVFDSRDEPGGMLRYGVSEQDLPRSVLDAEIEKIQALGVVFKQHVTVGSDLLLEELLKTFDAVFLGMGNVKADDLEILGFNPEHVPLAVDKNTYLTDIPGVFAGGDMRRRLKLTVRSLEDGKRAAMSIVKFLNNEKIPDSKRPFNSRMGKLEPEELAQLTGPVGTNKRVQMFEPDNELTKEEAQEEASQCLHCDCRKPDSCKLRIYAQEYGAKATHYRGKRRSYVRMNDHPDLIYEQGKCINCGICVRLTEQQRERLGLTFIGRGFDVKVAVPFSQSIQAGLTETAHDVVKACPTGALAFK